MIAPSIILTAAHNLDWGADQVYFDLNGQTYQGVNWAVHEDWTTNLATGSDIAMVLLDRPVTGVTPATLNTDPNVRNKTVNISGFGTSGTGTTGNINGVDGQRRAGKNKIDGYFASKYELGIPEFVLPYLGEPNSNKQFYYDFDGQGSYTSTDDIPISQEYSGAKGDSGGAGFIGDKLAGITSWGTSETSVFDTVAFMTNVAVFESWIQDKITLFETNGPMDAATTAGIDEVYGPEDLIDLFPDNGVGVSVAYKEGDRQWHFINYLESGAIPTLLANPNVPEPTALLSMAGIAGLGLMRRRRSA